VRLALTKDILSNGSRYVPRLSTRMKTPASRVAANAPACAVEGSHKLGVRSGGNPAAFSAVKTGFPRPPMAWANIGASRRSLRLNHSPMVRTTLEVGRMFTVLPPNSLMIASSYSDNVFSGAFDLTCTIL
jgi:hypothetical protein